MSDDESRMRSRRQGTQPAAPRASGEVAARNPAHGGELRAVARAAPQGGGGAVATARVVSTTKGASRGCRSCSGRASRSRAERRGHGRRKSPTEAGPSLGTNRHAGETRGHMVTLERFTKGLDESGDGDRYSLQVGIALSSRLGLGRRRDVEHRRRRQRRGHRQEHPPDGCRSCARTAGASLPQLPAQRGGC
jgi:hypothetical protein